MTAVGGWVRIIDTEWSGRVTELDADRIEVTMLTPTGREFTVPRDIVQECQEPAVEAAAHDILSILREVDPGWSITDTEAIRVRIVLQVLETVERERGRS